MIPALVLLKSERYAPLRMHKSLYSHLRAHAAYCKSHVELQPHGDVSMIPVRVHPQVYRQGILPLGYTDMLRDTQNNRSLRMCRSDSMEEPPRHDAACAFRLWTSLGSNGPWWLPVSPVDGPRKEGAKILIPPVLGRRTSFPWALACFRASRHTSLFTSSRFHAPGHRTLKTAQLPVKYSESHPR